MTCTRPRYTVPPGSKTVNQPPSMFTNSEKIAQSYTFNKLMWTVGTAE